MQLSFFIAHITSNRPMKKLFGYIFIVLGVSLALVLTIQFLTSFSNLITRARVGGNYDAGFLSGAMLFFVFMIAVIVLLIRTGLKWTKSSSESDVSHDVIDRDLFHK
jgi:hypothetical protein